MVGKDRNRGEGRGKKVKEERTKNCIQNNNLPSSFPLSPSSPLTPAHARMRVLEGVVKEQEVRWFLPGRKCQVRHAGTAAIGSTVCFGCPKCSERDRSPRCRRPASHQPHRFHRTQGEPWHDAVANLKFCIPPDIAAPQHGPLALSRVTERPLFTEGILEVPEVSVRVVAADDRRIATRRRMVVADAKQRFGRLVFSHCVALVECRATPGGMAGPESPTLTL